MIGLLALAAAQATSGWTTPQRIPKLHAEGATADQPRRIEPIGSYTLALIWTPQHCFQPVPGAESFECGSAPGTGFVLHGLWPDGRGATWPQWCEDAAILPERVIRRYYRTTPSAQLMQHEWAKHGTCMRTTPDAYFTRATRLFGRLRFPDMNALSRAPLTTGRFTQAFARANRGVRPDMVNLNLDRDGWLREVWLCLDTNFRPEKCRIPVSPDRPLRIRQAG